jgi:hypothetical protein
MIHPQEKEMSIATVWRRAKLIVIYAILFIGIVAVIQWEHIPPGSFGGRLNSVLRGSYFDFVRWEAEALTDKAHQELTTPQHYLDDPTRRQVVLDYFDLVGRIHRLEWEIESVYSNPDIADPEAASAEQRATLEQLRTEQAKMQGTAEAIMEEQIASVLEDEGFGILGEVMPPVRFHFSPLPKSLVISPRSEISLLRSEMLRGDIDLDRIEETESQVDESLDVSSLIVPIGGFGIWPAMTSETSNLTWALSTAAHEWVHHYLFFWLKPVGLYYLERPDVRTMNETAADLAGDAIAEKVLARYYPEFLPPATATPEPDPDAPPTPTPEPPEFDFFAEMRETRVNADQLLAEGKIEEAEAYMEQRRRFFIENGYNLRKLNQAYFAFYGAYTASPTGQAAAGEDPIGGPVRTLWEANPSVKVFLDTLAPLTSREELLALLVEMDVEYPQPTSDQN